MKRSFVCMPHWILRERALHSMYNRDENSTVYKHTLFINSTQICTDKTFSCTNSQHCSSITASSFFSSSPSCDLKGKLLKCFSFWSQKVTVNIIFCGTIFLPFPLLLACCRIIWLSSSCSSDFSSWSFVLLFLTIDATSDNALLSVATSRNFSAPSFIWKLSREM